MKLKYIVTGTGRCGTVYMARFLTHIGIPCGHEAIFNWEGLEFSKSRLNGEIPIENSACSLRNHITKEVFEPWFDPTTVIAESSYLAAPYLDDPILDGVKIIHLLRNPLKTLSSWVSDIHFFDPKNKKIAHYRNFIYSNFPRIKQEKTEIEKACRYLIEWNKLIERTSRERIVVKIEDYPFQDLINFLCQEKADLLENKKINSWKKGKKDLTMLRIPKGNTKREFEEYIRKYKYEEEVFNTSII